MGRSAVRRDLLRQGGGMIEGEQVCAPVQLKMMSGLHQPGAGQLLRDDGPIGGMAGSAQ
jgi:hypothetical protein